MPTMSENEIAGGGCHFTVAEVDEVEATRLKGVAEATVRQFRGVYRLEPNAVPSINVYLFRSFWHLKEQVTSHGVKLPAMDQVAATNWMENGTAAAGLYVEGHTIGRSEMLLQSMVYRALEEAVFGRDLPTWLREGMTAYFRDGIMIEGDLVLGLSLIHI